MNSGLVVRRKLVKWLSLIVCLGLLLATFVGIEVYKRDLLGNLAVLDEQARNVSSRVNQWRTTQTMVRQGLLSISHGESAPQLDEWLQDSLSAEDKVLRWITPAPAWHRLQVAWFSKQSQDRYLLAMLQAPDEFALFSARDVFFRSEKLVQEVNSYQYWTLEQIVQNLLTELESQSLAFVGDESSAIYVDLNVATWIGNACLFSVLLLLVFISQQFVHETIRVGKLESDRELALRESELKSAFLSTMSHELRTPLTGVFGFLQAIKKVNGDHDKVDGYVRRALASYDSIIAIVNDILDLSRIEKKGIELNPEAHRLARVANEVFEEFEVLAEDKGLDIQLQFFDDAAQTVRLFDEGRVKQILRNLLSNAVKFTLEGRILMTVQSQSTHPMVVFTVTDTGIGIAEEAQERIFQAFEQADMSTTRQFGGSGLGMAIVSNLLARMQGRVSLQSRPSVGTSITVEIPMLEVDAAEEKCPVLQDRANFRFNDLKILLVEDILTNQVVFQALVEDTGAQVRCADDGKKGLELALEWRPDVIFMDIQMPVMDGVTAFTALRKEGFDRPIYACTGNVSQGDAARYREVGFDGVISKPYLIDHITDVLKTLSH